MFKPQPAMTIILFYAMHDPFINLFLGWKPYLFQPDGIASGINAMYKLRPAKGRLYLFRPQKIVRYIQYHDCAI